MERQDAFSPAKSASPPAREAGAARLWRPLPLAVAAVACAELLCATVQPAPGEHLLLRWLRAVADHPVRSGLAFYFLSWSASTRPQAGAGAEKTGPS